MALFGQFFYNLLVFIIAISFLVFIHELGHYLFARLCNVKVLKFSIGFGKALYSKKNRNDTEFVIASIPIGGYVQMLDENQAEQSQQHARESFHNATIWSKTGIILAGPIFNLILAVILFFIINIIGIKGFAPVVDTIALNSITYNTALQPGDEITAINENKTFTTQAVYREIIRYAGDKDDVTFTTIDKYGQTHAVAINLHALGHMDNSEIFSSLGLTFRLPAFKAIVGKILPDSPAARAGLQPQDKILSVGNTNITSWQEFVELIQGAPNTTMQLSYIRSGAKSFVDITPTVHYQTDGKKIGMIGAQLSESVMTSDLLRVQNYSSLAAVNNAIYNVWDLSTLTLKMLYKMLIGAADVSNLSGPIHIAEGAGQSLHYGITAFLQFLALISVSLGVLNLLPIPLLDGGQLVYNWVNYLCRNKVSKNIQAASMYLGLCILISAMLLALYNDLTRLLN